MRRSQEKQIYQKITSYIGSLFNDWIESKEWTGKEIAKALDIDNARVTNYRKGDRIITKATLAKMIQIGMVTMDDIKKHVEFTDEEIACLSEQYALISDKGATIAYIKLKQLGVDPEEVMLDYLKNINKKGANMDTTEKLANFHDAAALALMPGRSSAEIEMKRQEMLSIITDGTFDHPADIYRSMFVVLEQTDAALKTARDREHRSNYIGNLEYSITADMELAIRLGEMERLKEIADRILSIHPYNDVFDGFRERILDFIASKLKIIHDACHKQALIENEGRRAQ